MMNHRIRQYAFLVMACGLMGAVSGCGDNTDELPAFDSLEATYRAVDEVVDCSGDPPEPTLKVPKSGGPTGESMMCTNTVEVLWFDSDEARANVYDLFANAGNTVYMVEGRNWFVVDASKIMVETVSERTIDMEQLADALEARYTVGQ